MHRPETVAEAIRLRDEEGLGARRVARALGLSVATVRDWHAGKLPRHSLRDIDGAVLDSCRRCGRPGGHDFSALPSAYVYLLGLYLGDGTISEHRRGVHRLRIFLDLRYPGIIDQCAQAIRKVMPRSRVGRQEKSGSLAVTDEPSCAEVSAYSKSWPCLFPQHGGGMKHTRRIWLAEWQQELASRWPDELLKGMVHSDGARFINQGRDGWRHPRYAFTNVSTDVTSIYCTACDRLGVHWTAAFPSDETKAVIIYVSRKRDVARLDEFIGPKR